MPIDDLKIVPSTKIAALLNAYPDLEDVLIQIAPPFRKLKNPFLRKSVAKVASLRQAAAVAQMPVDELINKLRAAVGQEPIVPEDVGPAESYFAEQPDWFDQEKVIGSLDVRGNKDTDTMPLTQLVRATKDLQDTQIFELITTFVPAPGIDIMKAKGFAAWTVQEAPELVRTYFSKPDQ